jgi:hypothetical protein
VLAWHALITSVLKHALKTIHMCILNQDVAYTKGSTIAPERRDLYIWISDNILAFAGEVKRYPEQFEEAKQEILSKSKHNGMCSTQTLLPSFKLSIAKAMKYIVAFIAVGFEAQFYYVCNGELTSISPTFYLKYVSM